MARIDHFMCEFVFVSELNLEKYTDFIGIIGSKSHPLQNYKTVILGQ